jgi:Tfp pilus assembly protein PilF
VPIVAAAALAIYLPGLGNELVFDDGALTDSDLLARYSSLQLRVRMLSYGSFVWVHALLGDGWWKQRLVNIAIHLAVVAAMWAFYREILRALTPPEPDPGEERIPYHESPALGFAVGVFALNPVAVYGVAYLIQRSILLATLFTIAAFWLFARGLRTGQWWLHALAALCYAAAVLSKEHAVLAPLGALAIYFTVARTSGKRLAMVGGATVALMALMGALVWKRFDYIFGTPFDEYSRAYLVQLAALSPDAPRHAWGLSIINQCWLFFEYGARWMLPFADWMSISMRPPFPLTWTSLPQVLGVPAYLAAIVVGFRLVLRHRDWRALLGLSILLPALLFATEFATVWVQDPFVLYRSYLWAVGIPGLVFLVVHGTSPRALLAVGTIVGVLFSWQAIERVLSLATPETAWTDAIAKLPKDPRAVGRWFPFLNRGGYYAEHDQYELAIRDFETSASLGDLGMGAFNAGSMLVATGKPQQSLPMFDAAEKQGYDLYNLPFQRGLALSALGRPKEAHEQFAKALTMSVPPDVADIILLQRGRAALQSGLAERALRDLQIYVSRHTTNAEARYLVAMALIAYGDPAGALDSINAAPAASSGPSHYARAVAYHGLGRKAEAAREIETAIRMGPDNRVLHEWQARIRAMP